MGLETANWIEELVPTNPPGSDPFSQGDDHLRLIKQVTQNQFPSLGQEAVTVTAEHINGTLSYGASTGYTADLNFSDATKGIVWTLPSAKTVKLYGKETTIDLIDYEFVAFQSSGLMVNADDVAADNAFIAVAVDQATVSPQKLTAIGFNDYSTYEFFGGILYDLENDNLWLGDNDVTGSSHPLQEVYVARSASIYVTLTELKALVDAFRGGTTGQTLTVTKDSATEMDFTGAWA